MTNNYLYNGHPAQIQPAAGVKGVLIRDLNGEITFRVYHNKHDFTDYDIRHDDLGVTIDAEELAAFYSTSEQHFIDHSPEVLGLKQVED